MEKNRNINLDKNIHTKEREVLLEKVHDKTIEVLESGDKDIPITRININEIYRKNILNFYNILTSKGFEMDIENADLLN